MATVDDIRSALSQVAYPGFTKDIVSFGFVKEIKADAKPYIELEITASSEEIASILKEEIKTKEKELSSFSSSSLIFLKQKIFFVEL